MSSATSTEAGFRPWHFFVLAALAAATVAVLMSRQSAPEHLILLSLTIGAAGAAAAAFYRMLAPLTVDEGTLGEQRRSERARTAMEREKALVLRSIKELEFDRAMGKVSPRDFDEMAARLRGRAMMLIKQADEGSVGYRELIERELSARLVTRARPGAAAPPQPASDIPPSEALYTTGASVGSRRVEGAPAAQSCGACGTGNDRDAAFCKRCGARLEAVTA
ncbi:MAG: hypothetical protein V7647_4266 [Acidobacteriota bacterium]